MRSMDIAATGMQAQQTNIEVIANNIANMTTTAFKRRRPEFQDLIYQQLGVAAGANSSDTGTIVPAGAEVGLGVQTAAIYPILEQGNLQQTNNTLDLAIQGAGYFQIQLPYGQIGYTRDGTFALSPTGQIVTADGYVVWPGMTVPQNATSISINAQGQVQVTIPNQTQPQLIGQLQIVTFANPAGLAPQGGNMFFATAASGNPIQGVPGSPGFGTVMQGFIETSNVNVVTEITDLITAQRAYEMNSRVIQTSDQIFATLTNPNL
ncbi:MAG: flagellar basal-body rod protein FlgG [Acidobacteriia bacterium]|nr:flagellar basal-body rod protein FlgG [Methyloceanibacter sp.]MBX5472024.1 flagellar basal-body rod protein FlgG [Acetobacteraceae bacterium]MCL6492148.1 flagellar basal-body rod protein FlgG [Terriglobia bacterium]